MEATYSEMVSVKDIFLEFQLSPDFVFFQLLGKPERVGEFQRVIFVRFLVSFVDEQIGTFVRKRTSESVAPGFFGIHQAQESG